MQVRKSHAGIFYLAESAMPWAEIVITEPRQLLETQPRWLSRGETQNVQADLVTEMVAFAAAISTCRIP